MEFKVSFSKKTILEGDLAIFFQTNNNESFGLSEVDLQKQVPQAITVEDFKGEENTKLQVLVPHKSAFKRFVVLGLGEISNHKNDFWLNMGGKSFDIFNKDQNIVIFLDVLEKPITQEQIKDFLVGMMLKKYRFDHFKTQKKENKEENKEISVYLVTNISDSCQSIVEEAKAIATSVYLSRDLINQPANILGTEEFVAQIQKLKDLGIEIEILDKNTMTKLGMGALLAVAQGSQRPPFVAIMRWNGGETDEAPLAFVGKGVVFDSGGISLKPGSGMEEMKADMAGAAAVVGLMNLLATRKAKVNVVGMVGLVENMPGSHAQRPGDVVVSMSGQTIEVINTDAEGRMVLADVLWYCETVIKPKLIIDLATLTGAIMVALGRNYAGLFANDNDLAQNLMIAGQKTGEKVWQMPIGTEYDLLINSHIADIKNVSDRFDGGSITAAQFLKRFVKKTSWAHLDIAGTAMGVKPNAINNSWGVGFGVRLLNEFVKTNHEL